MRCGRRTYDALSLMTGHYRVFISSTYLDNVKRREVVVEAVERAGPMTAVCMERFTANDRPTVEVCRSRAAECDVFVGIVAHRYGWEPEGQATGEGKSISWLEYEAAREAGRPCLMFEIDPAVPFTLADLDAEPGRWAKAEKLARFKALYAGHQLPGIFNEGNLGLMVHQALLEWRERCEGKPVLPPTPRLETELKRYGEEALKAHGTLLLSGFKTKLRVPIDLEELYIPLRATSDLRGHGTAAFADARHAKEELQKEGRAPEVSLLDAFRLAAKVKRGGLVILGEPGSGKTTHLKQLLICSLKEGSEKLGLRAGMVPVLLPLRGLDDPERETVGHFIERHLNEQLGLSSHFGKKLLERGNLLLLFDGLDEVANPERREKVARWVERVLTAHSNCWPVVTCRFAGYGEQGTGRSEVRLNSKFLELHIQPLREGQTEDFVRKWYGLVECGLDPDSESASRLAEKRAGELIATLRSHDLRTARVAEMTGNPLLLANLCLVHRDHGRLPKDRRRLYDECVDVLLERWRERQGPLASVEVDQAKRALQPIAEWLHQEKGRTRASGAELEPVLEPVLKLVRWKAGGAKEFLGTVRDESGLLTGWGSDQFGFMHLGFQEYLAASEMRRRAAEAGEKQGAVLESLARSYGESWWQEVLLLFVAMSNPSMFGPLMREVVKQPSFAGHRDLLGLLLEEAAERDAEPFVELLRQKEENNLSLWGRQRAALEALERIGGREELEKELAGTLQSQFQDWLVRAGGAPAIVTEKGGVELMLIPGGEFLMGSLPGESDSLIVEKPQRRVTVSPFLLSRYPVTNEQYGRYLKENPHIKAPRHWGDRRFNQARQPVVGVTWDEAMAYAAWDAAKLPTEAEWEYACRAGTTAERYEADLDAIAWHGGNSGFRLHPVGQKRPNAWGLHEMLGSVNEWCSDERGHSVQHLLAPDPAGLDPMPFRAIRGGGWHSFARDCRAAAGRATSPDFTDVALGFRIARDTAR
ncbi:MAG TPA: SUMF1/EgtB/PvdO family nonheme iron enzyme [Myxococcaceae bacterium]|nr:SUMF1/EgtB/PvdO family nonheme iron enzyme [Myxococcaceae bacterium]